ncbi:hypothetical protein SLEP1_g10374 [Rubroshorea leprosula]|uniref:Reverse transcriptase Ty1/copia-type domain-containing protein n=1 Tax=Rubroshorea leprosula TaxID=152421 RepID=A0AAV5IFV3_9ROSI|nr:hypothetical protein SLEP1_g10374 [Rubroshorea leprosula]
MDVKNAFLNGDLVEEVYMQPPPRLEHPPNKVCQLKRALYGLKQAPRAWFAKFAPPSVNLVLLLDLMILRIHDLKQFLNHKFEMKDLGVLSYFLGLEIASTHFEPNVRFTSMDGSPLASLTCYRQLVGSLIYLTTTRPYIAYAVHVVSQFMATPYFTHYAVVLCIIRYIKGTIFHGLHFSTHSSLELCAYSDADWAGDSDYRKSTTGYCLFLGDSLISWRSKKQTVPSCFSTEAEYRALGDTTSELLNLCWLLKDMDVPQPPVTNLYCDNQSVMQIAHNDVFHKRTKHIEVDCHFIRHHVAQGTIHLVFIGSANQLVDFFTKAHFLGRFRTLISKLKLVSSQPP